MTARRLNYGIDAPMVVRNMFLAGSVGALAGAFLYFALRSYAWVQGGIAAPIFFIGLTFLIQALIMLWGSKWGKLRLRDRLMNSIDWRGDEQVLDVGCGHGLMLIGAARRLRSGKAVGIDLWQTEDQSDNSRAATMQNVEIENVADRVELLDGDARKMPFPNDTFDLVLSSWALHNIYDDHGRAEAVREIVRVLKPGGRAVVVDIRHGRDYAQLFRQLGMNAVKLEGPNFLFVIPTLKVTAMKPLAKAEARV